MAPRVKAENDALAGFPLGRLIVQALRQHSGSYGRWTPARAAEVSLLGWLVVLDYVPTTTTRRTMPVLGRGPEMDARFCAEVSLPKQTRNE